MTRALRRKSLYRALAIAGIGVAALLLAYYSYQRLLNPAYPIGTRAVVLVLILLNARQNYRQHKYCAVLEQLLPARSAGGHGR